MNSILRKGVVSFIGRSKLSILIYHRVHKDSDRYITGKMNAETFDWQMALISKYFNVISLTEATHALKNNCLKPGSLCITFDDGYADNAAVAYPILRKYGLSATFFVSTGYLDGGRMWNDTVIETVRSQKNGQYDLSMIGLSKYHLDSLSDRQQCARSIINAIKYLPQQKRHEKIRLLSETAKSKLPDHLMMTSNQVKFLSDEGMEIGGHTVTHPILTTLKTNDAFKEIHDGKLQLEKITGKEVRLFAFPNGKPGQDYSSVHVNILHELGFYGGVSTQCGVSNCNTDIYQLRRFTPWDRNPNHFLIRLLRNYFNNG